MKKIVLIFFTTLCFWALAQSPVEEPTTPVEEQVVDNRKFFTLGASVQNPKNKECEIIVLKHIEGTGLWLAQVDRRDSGKQNRTTVDDFLLEKVEHYGKIGYYYRLEKILSEGEKFLNVVPYFEKGEAFLKIGYSFDGYRGQKEISLKNLSYLTSDYSQKSCLD